MKTAIAGVDNGLWVVFPLQVLKPPLETPGKSDPMKTREITRKKIVMLLTRDPRLTTDVLAAKLGITRKGVEWQITQLKTSGQIRRIGPAKGGHWEVIK